MNAVFAHIAHEEPAAVLSVLSELLNKLHVTPVDSVELARVVVAVAAQSVQPAVGAGKLIPLFAGHFAGFAADADRRVGIKSHGLSHLNSPFLGYPHLVTVLVARARDEHETDHEHDHGFTLFPHYTQMLFLRASKRSDRR